MKLLIIGLDGLDPDLVERWSMHWFKQKAWGRHYVGFLSTVFTPIVWGSFLTGLNVEKQGYNINVIEEKRRIAQFVKPLQPLYKLRRKLPVRKLGLRQLLVKLGLVKRYTPPVLMPEGLIERTFIEELKREGYNVAAIEIPSYNETHKAEIYRQTVSTLLMQDSHLEERMKFVEEVLADTKARIEKAAKYVDANYDVVFVYSPLPDIALHLAAGLTGFEVFAWLRGIHYKLWETIKPLIEKASTKGYAILIVSDHGFDLTIYEHSNYGFWSLNIKPPSWWHVETILDFKPLIIRLVVETHSRVPLC